jgi:hypothetical protein
MKFFRRKRFIINKPLQYRLVIFPLCYIVAFLIVFGCTLFIPRMFALDRGDMTSQEVVCAAHQLLYFHDHYWLAALVCLLAISLHSLRTSHQIAGPLHRFTSLFQAITTGHLPQPTRLRRGDYLGPEMAVINAMLASLRHNVTDINTAWIALEGPLTELQKVASSTPREELVQRLTLLVERGQQLAETLDVFSVETEA